MKIKKMLALCTVVATCFLFSCGKESVNITVRNITGAEISEILIYPENVSDDTSNRLEKNLPTGSQVEINLGKYTEEELANGYSLYIVNAEDGSDNSFSMLYFDAGDTVTFYIDDWGLAVGVYMTDEDIEEQIAEDHEDFLEYIEELEEEETAE